MKTSQLFKLVLLGIIILVISFCKPQQHTKPLIERKAPDKNGNSTYIIRQTSCGNHKDKYDYYIVLPRRYKGISKDQDRPTPLLGYVSRDTLFIIMND